MTIQSDNGGRWSRFGRRQVPVWFDSSVSVIDEFQTIGKHLRILKVIPNPFPFYDWIMGFYERPSNREAMNGPVLERSRKILDVGAGTGYLLSRLVRATTDEQEIMATTDEQEIIAVDLSAQMLGNSEAYLRKHSQLSSRIQFEQADCRSLPWPDGSFDLYVSSYPMVTRSSAQ
jgi:ubiquinone/menaquinone biosynthesis C-methylase UbiE